MLKDFLDEYERYRVIGHDNNSIAVIVRHISGNLISRFTEFLSSDGEKTWRNRDSEFENRAYSRKEVDDIWNKGWQVLNAELAGLDDSDLQRQVTIRGQGHTVH